MHEVRQLCNWKKENNLPAAIMFSLLFPGCCVTNHTFIWGMLVQSCWSQFPAFHQLTAPAWPWEQQARDSLAARPAHTLQTLGSRWYVFKANSPHLKITAKSFLLSNSCWDFSRKKDRETLEDSRVHLHYNSADSADAGRSFDSQAQTQHTQAPLASKNWDLKWQTC